MRSILALLILIPSIASSQTRHDQFLRVGTTDSLDMTYYMPSTARPPSGYPAIIFVHGFADDKNADTLNCRIYARMGYATLCYSVRGQGLSSGTSGIMSSEERHDLRDVVNFVRQLPDVDSLHVGIVGGSQGGLHGLWAAVDKLPVSAVSCDVIVPAWASDLFANGSIRRTFMTLLFKINPVHYGPERDTLWQLLRVDAFDSLRARFPRGRDIAPPQIETTGMPILTFLKWQDHYFGAESGIQTFLNSSNTKKLYLGTGGHWSDADSSESVFQSGLVTRWFDYFLKGVTNGILMDPLITYAESSLPFASTHFQWSRFTTATWPPPGVTMARLYFAPDSALVANPGTVSRSDTVELFNDYRNPSYTFDTAYVEGFRGPRFEAVVPRVARAFMTPPLPQDIEWLGQPLLHLTVTADSAIWPLHAQIYEMDSTGVKQFINRVSFTARNWSIGSSGSINAPGIPHAHRFTRGNRIRIELTNIDNDPPDRPEVGGFPFVLPQLRKARVQVVVGAAGLSYLDLPCIGSPVGVSLAAQQQPSEFTLLPNYPNPFNPSTTIPFTLDRASLVTLRIFDILGREVAQLANGTMMPGLHEVKWEGRGVASGVYFVRLEASCPGYKGTTVRKIMMLK